MDEIESRAEEMLRLIKSCPSNGVTDRDVAVAYLRREHVAGKLHAAEELRRKLSLPIDRSI